MIALELNRESARHPGTSIAPAIAASTKPRLRGLDSMNPSFGSFGSPTGVAPTHRCAVGGSLVALRPRLSTGLPLSRPSRGGAMLPVSNWSFGTRDFELQFRLAW